MAPVDIESATTESAQWPSIQGYCSGATIAAIALHCFLVTAFVGGFYSCLMATGVVDAYGNLLILGMLGDPPGTPDLEETSDGEQDLRSIFTFMLGGLFTFYLQECSYSGIHMRNTIKKLNIIANMF